MDYKDITKHREISHIYRNLEYILEDYIPSIADSAIPLSKLLAFLNESLHVDVVEIIYEKKNGEMRQAFATLKPEYLPPVPDESSVNKKKREMSPEILTYFDISKQAFRSFYKINLVSVTFFEPQSIPIDE